MKKLLTAIAIISTFTVNAELQVRTKPFTANGGNGSAFLPYENFTAEGFTVMTTNSDDNCLISQKILKRNNTSAIEFFKHLKDLNDSEKHYRMFCYTEGGKVTQVIISE